MKKGGFGSALRRWREEVGEGDLIGRELEPRSLTLSSMEGGALEEVDRVVWPFQKSMAGGKCLTG